MKLRVLTEAENEYNEALDYYIERSEEVANSFIVEFESAIDTILQSPQRWRGEQDGTRIYRLANYPYTLRYQEGEGFVLLIAVAHNRRRPGYWKKRYKS